MRYHYFAGVSTIRRPEKDITIAVFGKSGVGKSALCNCLLKNSKSSKIFKSQNSGTPVTTKTEFAFFEYKERLVYVYDTPGEMGSNDPKIIDFLLECVISSPTGFDCLIVAFQVGRGPNDMSFIGDLETFFGNKSFYNNIIVVFTKTDAIDEEEGETFEQYLETLNPEMKKFIDKCGGYAHVLQFSKKAKGNEYYKQAERIMDAIIEKTINVDPIKLEDFDKSYKVVEKELFGATSRSLNNARINLFAKPSNELRTAVEMDIKESARFFKYLHAETK